MRYGRVKCVTVKSGKMRYGRVKCVTVEKGKMRYGIADLLHSIE